MDYQLFLLAAIRERYEATGDTQLAIREGIARTGRPITNAALIMIVVFIAFGVTGPIPPTELGVTLAARRPARRHRRPDDARPVGHGPARRAQLVAPALARPDPPQHPLLPLTRTDAQKDANVHTHHPSPSPSTRPATRWPLERACSPWPAPSPC